MVLVYCEVKWAFSLFFFFKPPSYFKKAPTQNKASQTKIFYLPLPIFSPPFFNLVWFYFVQAQQSATGKVLGFFRGGLERSYKPNAAALCKLRQQVSLAPALLLPALPGAEIPFQPTPALSWVKQQLDGRLLILEEEGKKPDL